MKSNNAFLGILLFWAIIFVVEFLAASNDSFQTKVYEVQLMIIYAVSQYLTIKRYGIVSLFSLVLVGIFFFSIGGICYFFFNGNEILYYETGFGSYTFSHTIIQQCLIIYTIFILFATITYHHYCIPDAKSYIRYDTYEKTSTDNMLFEIGKTLMWIFLVFEIYKGYLSYTNFSVNRALIFLYGNMENPIPTWVRFLSTFFQMGYFFIVSSHPLKSEFKKYSLLFSVILIPEFLLGNRSLIGGFLLYFLWYYSRYYNPKFLSLKKVAIGGILILILFQFMQFTRDGEDAKDFHLAVSTIIKSQIGSFYLLALYIQHADQIEYYLYPFVLYSFLSGFSGYSGQSIENLQHNCGVGHQLSYTLNHDYYLAGASLGSSSIVELYDMGLIAIFFGAFFYSLMIIFCERKFATNRFFMFISFMLLTNFVTSSRGSYFPGAYAILKNFIFYTFIIWGFKKFYGKKLIKSHKQK